MFTKFEKFEPYMSEEEMKHFITLYKRIKSPEVTVQKKIEHYALFNREIERVRKKIRERRAEIDESSSQIFPLQQLRRNRKSR
ncbi:hypothetical protein [Falsibacillus pallidus]|uniref:hypothetical protein n=1 Tax=Falsibacillus pallidus TaxID=493781 RepID=UPI003D971EAA